MEASGLYLKENVQDAWLISGLAGIEEQFGNLLTRQQEITQKETDLKKADTASADATKKLEEASRQCSLKKQELETEADNDKKAAKIQIV